MQNIHLEIGGLSPYYFNRYLEEKPGKGDKAEKEYAMKTVHFQDGALCFPGIQIKGCIISGIRLAKIKLETSMQRLIDYVNSSVQIWEFVIFKPEMSDKNVKLVKERTNVERNKVRLNWYARISTKWGAEFDLQFPDIVPSAAIVEALKTGGQFSGIGGRRNWGRGRFEVTTFKESTLS
jgi:hypothetical protein